MREHREMKRSRKHLTKKKHHSQFPHFSLVQITCTPLATPFMCVWNCLISFQQVSGSLWPCDLVQEGPSTYCRALRKRTQLSFHPGPLSAFMRDKGRIVGFLNILNLVFKVSSSILRWALKRARAAASALVSVLFCPAGRHKVSA